jgi:hypothetical protein
LRAPQRHAKNSSAGASQPTARTRRPGPSPDAWCRGYFGALGGSSQMLMSPVRSLPVCWLTNAMNVGRSWVVLRCCRAQSSAKGDERGVADLLSDLVQHERRADVVDGPLHDEPGRQHHNQHQS